MQHHSLCGSVVKGFNLKHESSGSNPAFANFKSISSNQQSHSNTRTQCEIHGGLVDKHMFSEDELVMETWVQISYTAYFNFFIGNSQVNSQI